MSHGCSVAHRAEVEVEAEVVTTPAAAAALLPIQEIGVNASEYAARLADASSVDAMVLKILILLLPTERKRKRKKETLKSVYGNGIDSMTEL